ncbi:hypothetical protein GOP47_0003205 [Adiantum capillus-veneris]|uniref:Uncharacterized protein n=1 Tax=Adiantum capillus-veneris TaxID=13818 RepID=A0A9D4VC20_ADICA|nr:hypothetical protein GOP47_0003205 [Adiantum capillus-veneris]
MKKACPQPGQMANCNALPQARNPLLLKGCGIVSYLAAGWAPVGPPFFLSLFLPVFRESSSVSITTPPLPAGATSITVIAMSDGLCASEQKLEAPGAFSMSRFYHNS